MYIKGTTKDSCTDKGGGEMSTLDYKLYFSRILPHFQPKYSIFAITIRLAFSLSNQILHALKKEKDYYEEQIKVLKGEELEQYKKDFGFYYYSCFDDLIWNCHHNEIVLTENKYADIVTNCLTFLDNKKYKLFAYCIMPNHIHFLISPLEYNNELYYSLSQIMHSFKRFTSGKFRELCSSKKIWNSEYYDHCIRNEHDFDNQLNYLIMNPVKAKLIDQWDNWKYTYVSSEILK